MPTNVFLVWTPFIHSTNTGCPPEMYTHLTGDSLRDVPFCLDLTHWN